MSSFQFQTESALVSPRPSRLPVDKAYPVAFVLDWAKKELDRKSLAGGSE